MSTQHNENGLTDQQQEFCNAYLEDPEHNATKAAIAAKYSSKSARAVSSRLLTNANIKAYIDKQMNTVIRESMERFKVNQDRIIQELACMAFLDIADLLDEDGQFLKLDEIPEHARRAIVGMDFEELFDYKRGEREHVGNVRKMKLGDKKGALELLGKHLKMWTDRLEGEFTQVNMTASLPRESSK